MPNGCGEVREALGVVSGAGWASFVAVKGLVS
jgi:hypothetical protein